MHFLALRFALLLAAAFLCSCASHQVAFNEADFARYAAAGTSTVKGLVFRVGSQDTVWVQKHGSIVKLLPANAYTDEIVQRKYESRQWLARADARLRKYVRRVKTDEDGNFIFRHVPAGEFYVACHYKWTYPTDGTDADGNYEEVQASDDQWLYDRISLKSGQTITVKGWYQGR